MKNLTVQAWAFLKKKAYPMCWGGIILFSLFVMVYNIDAQKLECGEASHYAVSTYTLLNKGSISYTRQDVKNAESVMRKFELGSPYPRYAYNNRSFLHKFATAPAADQDFAGRSFYWGTYSALCIPAFWCFRAFNVSGDSLFLAFKLTNILMLLIPLLAIVFLLKAENWVKSCWLLAFAMPPALQYLNWPSAEICLYMFVVLSLLFFYNRQYCRSALCLSLGATLNVSLFPMAIVIYAAMLCDYRKKVLAEKIPSSEVCKELFKKTVLYGCCYLPVLHAVGMTYLQFSSFVTMDNMKDFSWLLPRYWAYLFDLNFGFLPYYNLFFILFAVIMVYFVIKKEYILLSVGASFLFVVFCFSMIHHINCGMEGISRYGAWSGAFIVFTAVTGFEKGFFSKRYAMFFTAAFFILSALWGFASFQTHHWNKVSEFVFSHCPRLYKPLYSTFISRTLHIDGGYWYKSPLSYVAGKKRIILIQAVDLKNLWEYFAVHTPEQRKALEEQREKLLAKNKENTFVYLYADAKECTPDNSLYRIVISSKTKENYILRSGFASPEVWGVWSVWHTARADFYLPPSLRGKKLRVGMVAMAFGKPENPPVATVKSNNKFLYNMHFSKVLDRTSFDITVPEEMTKESYLPLEFHISNPCAPSSIDKKSPDTRLLGVGLVCLTIKRCD